MTAPTRAATATKDLILTEWWGEVRILVDERLVDLRGIGERTWRCSDALDGKSVGWLSRGPKLRGRTE